VDGERGETPRTAKAIATFANPSFQKRNSALGRSTAARDRPGDAAVRARRRASAEGRDDSGSPTARTGSRESAESNASPSAIATAKTHTDQPQYSRRAAERCARGGSAAEHRGKAWRREPPVTAAAQRAAPNQQRPCGENQAIWSSRASEGRDGQVLGGPADRGTDASRLRRRQTSRRPPTAVVARSGTSPHAKDRGRTRTAASSLHDPAGMVRDRRPNANLIVCPSAPISPQ